MPDNIDSISIELTADTSSAEESLNKLIGRLNLLKVAVQGASNFTKIAGGIQRIAEAARKIETDSGEKLSNLAHGLMELSKVGDMSNLGAAAKNLSSVIKAASGSGNSANLGGLANGIRGVSNALGGIKDADVSKLGAVRDALSGEMSGSLHSSARVSESAALGGMGGIDVGGSDVAASLGEIASSAASAGGELEDLLSKNGELSGEFETLLEDATHTSKALTDTGDSSKFAKMSLEEMERTIGSVTEQLQAMAGTAETAGNAVQNAVVGGNMPPVVGPYEPTRTGQFDVAERFANFRMSPLADEAENTSARLRETAEQASRTVSFFSRLSSAAKNASSHMKLFGKSAKNAGDDAEKGTSGMSKFLAQLKRVAYYRFIRMILREIAQAFKEGAQNLYQWSTANPGLSDFAKNMDRIATSVLYLKNSLGAMLEPLVRILTPVIEWVIDKLVWLIDKVNQFFAALSGAETYTAAKKVAQTWGDTSQQVANNTHKAAEEIKRTILGFDEINKLDKPNSGSYGGGSGLPSASAAAQDMFEERPLEGWAKTISDFIRTIASWIDSIFGPIKQLFTDAGDAFDNLNRSLDAAQQEDKTVNINVKINTTAEKLWNDFVDEWNAIKNKALFVTIRPATLPETLFKMVSDAWDGLPNRTLYVDVDRGEWDNTAWLAANMTNYVAYRTIISESKKGKWNATAWLAASMTDNVARRTIKAIVSQGDWNDTAWIAALMTNYVTIRTIESIVKKGKWAATAWTAATMTAFAVTRTITSIVKKGTWDATAWTAATMTTYTAPRTVTATVKIGEWNATAWTAALMTAYAITRTVTAIVKKGKWDAAAWLAANMTAYAITRTVTAVVQKGAWDATAWSAANMTSYSPTRTVTSVVKKGAWDDTAWTAATMTNYTVTRTVNVELKKKDWTTVTDFVDDSFGGASSGGGKTSGGGAGRTYGVDTKLNVPTEATLTDWWNATTTYWGKLLQVGGVAGLMVKLREPGEDGMETLASKIGEAWNALLQANKLTYGVIIQPVANKSGDILSKMGSKIGEWLFGIDKPTTSVTVNSTPGTGLQLSGTNHYTLKGLGDTEAKVIANAQGGTATYLGDDNKIHLNSIPGRVTHVAVDAQGGTATYLGDDQKLHLEEIPGRTAQIVADAIGGDGTYYKDNKIHLNPVPGGKTKISVSAVAAWASTIGGLFAYLGIPVDPSTDITAKAKKGWTGTYKSEVGADDTTSTITATVSTPWGAANKSFKEFIGASNFITKIKAQIIEDKTANRAKVETTNGVTYLKVYGETKSKGGALFGGKWHNIPQYASGTTNAHGSLFLAGEAGPEIVGHVGGRTEVLNKSQLAASMYSAVHSAMTGVTLDADFRGYGAGYADDGEHETMYQMMYEAFTAALARGEAMDREKVDLLRQINAKDTTVEVTAASMNRAQTRMNRRAGTTIVPVGT